MVSESGKPGHAGINVGKGDHRRRTWDGAIEKHRELIDEIAQRGRTAGTAFVSLCGERFPGDTQDVAEISSLFRFSFEICECKVLENEIQEQEPRTDKLDGMSLAGRKGLLADGAIQ